MVHPRLDLRVRRWIEELCNADLAVRQIAVDLNRYHLKIYHEIKCIRFIDKKLPKSNGYYRVIAETLAKGRSARWRKQIGVNNVRDAISER